MAKRRRKERTEERVGRIYHKTCSNIQIDLMDISKVMAVGVKAANDGLDDDGVGERVRAYVETIRKN